MRRFAGLLIFGMALGACHPKPDGDIVAVVNGDEITRTELNAALPPAPAGADPKLLRNATLDRLVNLHLMVQAAKSDGLDKSQDYIQKSHNADNLILSNLFIKDTADKLGQYHVDGVDDFIAKNPTRFQNREIFDVDQISVAQSGLDKAWFAATNSLDSIMQVLIAHNIAFQRRRTTIDSMNLDLREYQQIAAIPIGKPFTAAQNGLVIFNSTSARRVAPLTGDAATRAATELLQRKAQRDGLDNRMKLLRSSAKIDFQPGFAMPSALPKVVSP